MITLQRHHSDKKSIKSIHKEMYSLTAAVKCNLYLKNAEKFFYICSFSLNKFINHMPADKEQQLRQVYSLMQTNNATLTSPLFLLYCRQ